MIKGSAWVHVPQKIAHKHYIDPMTFPYNISLHKCVQTKQTEPPQPLLTLKLVLSLSPWLNFQVQSAAVSVCPWLIGGWVARGRRGDAGPGEGD